MAQFYDQIDRNLSEADFSAAGSQFKQHRIKKENWDLNFPYSLATLQQKGENDFQVESRFDLPINPESLQITTPYSINFTPTMSGIVEQHSGVVVNNISISGTTGVLPRKDSINKAWGLPGVLKDAPTVFFGSTLRAAQSFASNIKKAAGVDSSKIIYTEDDLKGGGDTDLNSVLNNTGYAQFLKLRNFLESYAITKKNSKNNSLRLGLVCWKDDALYLVTPQSFSLRRSVDSPYEYQYDLQMIGWARTNTKGIGATAASKSITSGSTRAKTFGNILNAIYSSRTLLKQAANVAKSLRGDLYQNVWGPVREIKLTAALFLSGVKSVGDYLHAIAIEDFKSSVIQGWDTIIFSAFPTDSNTQAAVKALTNASNEIKQTATPTNSFNTPNNQKLNKIFDKVQYIFDDPDTYSGIFDNIDVNSLNLPVEVQKKITEENARVQNFTRLDFENKRDQLLQTMAVYANAVGAGNDTYNTIYGIATPSQTLRNTPTTSDYAFLSLLSTLATHFSSLAVQASETKNANLPALIDTVAALANRSGIDFTIPVSRYPVPFVYGSSLEHMASIYLGNPNRWMEIATVNGLRAPYVDETGFTLPLVSNGSTNEVVVGDVTNLTIGQSAWLSSKTKPTTKRQILEILKLSPVSWKLKLSGESDLAVYTTADTSEIQSFLPHTVNSQMMLYIPSQNPVTGGDTPVKSLEGVSDLETLLDVGGVDALLDEDGDLVIGSDGSGKYAAGLLNIIQQIKLLFTTEKGSVAQHPSFGNTILIGGSISDATAKDIAVKVKNTIKSDAVFGTWKSSVQVNLTSTAAEINLVLEIPNTSQYVPVKVVIPR